MFFYVSLLFGIASMAAIPFACFMEGAVYTLSLFFCGLSAWLVSNRGGNAPELFSYLIVLFLAALSVFVFAGSFSLYELVIDQGILPWRWNIVREPASFLLFVISLLVIFKNSNDGGEGYLYIFLASLILSILFLGGWQIPFVSSNSLTQSIGPIFPGILPDEYFKWIGLSLIVLAKSALIFFLSLLARSFLPEKVYADVTSFGWMGMVPLSFVNLLVVSAMVIFAIR